MTRQIELDDVETDRILSETDGGSESESDSDDDDDKNGLLTDAKQQFRATSSSMIPLGKIAKALHTTI